MLTVLKRLALNGILWLYWPRQTLNVPTVLTEDTPGAVGLPLGLADVKVVPRRGCEQQA